MYYYLEVESFGNNHVQSVSGVIKLIAMLVVVGDMKFDSDNKQQVVL